MANPTYKIELEHNPELFEKIPVNFIYNRFDLQKGDQANVYLLRVEKNNKVIYIPLRVYQNIAELGIEFYHIPPKTLKQVFRYIFKKFNNVTEITYKNGFLAMGSESRHNYFILDIPDTFEQLQKRQTAESRKKLRKRTHLVERELGEISFEEHSREQVPEEVISRFFKFKNITHNRDYHLTEDQYLSNYYVTHIYVLKINGQVEALRLSCEQGNGVYAENHTYNPDLSKYRLGQLLYHYFLTRLVDKNSGTLFLSGGDYDYKRHYGSQELQVYDCTISRSPLKRCLAYIKRKLRPLKKLLLNRHNAAS